MPYLIHKDTDGLVIQFWNLHDGPLTVGRGEKAGGQIDDDELSQEHFSVVKAAGGFVIKDLNSKNGTRVNGRPTAEQQLQPGDQIKAGQTQFAFVEGLTTLAGHLEGDEKALATFRSKTKH